jgi:hypothetical protein
MNTSGLFCDRSQHASYRPGGPLGPARRNASRQASRQRSVRPPRARLPLRSGRGRPSSVRESGDLKVGRRPVGSRRFGRPRRWRGENNRSNPAGQFRGPHWPPRTRRRAALPPRQIRCGSAAGPGSPWWAVPGPPEERGQPPGSHQAQNHGQTPEERGDPGPGGSCRRAGDRARLAIKQADKNRSKPMPRDIDEPVRDKHEDATIAARRSDSPDFRANGRHWPTHHLSPARTSSGAIQPISTAIQSQSLSG